MKKQPANYFFCVLVICAVISSCKKDDLWKDLSLNLEQNNAFIENEMDQSSIFSDEAYSSGVIKSDFSGSELDIRHNCAQLTIDTLNESHKITIDFGTENCLGRDDRFRRGKIIVDWKGQYRKLNSTHTITFSDYHVNGIKIEGTRTVTNAGKDQYENTFFTISNSGKFTLTDGTVYEHQSSRIRTWTAGADTYLIWDDEYKITGTASLSNNKGQSLAAEITTPLHIALTCGNIKAGIIEFTVNPGPFSERILDYGNGNCDDQATVTVGGNTRAITLR